MEELDKNVVPIKRPRGRPKGSTNGAAQFRHYRPKQWLPWMDSLVLASIAGASNKELSERFDITVVHVSNILSTEQASKIVETVRGKLLDRTDDVAGVLDRIREKALKRVEAVLDNETLAANSPLSVGMFAQKAAQLTFPKTEENKGTVINGNVLIANPEYVKRIEKGLEISNRIDEKNKKIEEAPLRLASGDK